MAKKNEGGAAREHLPEHAHEHRHEHGVRVRWSRMAAADLVAIASYIQRTSPKAAEEFLKQGRANAGTLSDFPRRGRVVPELQRLGVTEWRELIFAPYRLIYTVQDDVVEIDAILDARRDIEELLLERLIRRDPQG